MNEINVKFELGLWYVVIYSNGTRLRFKFIGGEPPMVETEDGQIISLSEVINGAIKIIPD
ncbi:MAG: hypothetical protein IKV05_07075 [Bacteroidales bacterium]|nr:hypothetical protein [Bacteroidales bacterium]